MSSAFASDTGLIKLELQDAAAVGMGGAFTGEADRIGIEMVDRLQRENLIENLDKIFPIEPRQAVFPMEKMFVDQG